MAQHERVADALQPASLAESWRELKTMPRGPRPGGM